MSKEMRKLRAHCSALWQKRQEDEDFLLSNLPTAEYVPAPRYLVTYCANLGLTAAEERSFYQRMRVWAEKDPDGKALKITKDGCWQLDPETGEHVWLGNWYGRNMYHVANLLKPTWPLLNEIQERTVKRMAKRAARQSLPSRGRRSRKPIHLKLVG